MTTQGGTLDCAVCVIGAGPAGSSTALRLAQLGHDVCLIERDTFPRHKIGESLPPSILPVLETLGLREVMETAGFLRPRAAVVQWAGQRSSRAYGPEVAGFQVDRGMFDALILNEARVAGVRVLQPARAYRPYRVNGGWHVPLRGHEAVREVRAQFLVDAAGKHAALPRQPVATSAPTAAIYAYWQTPCGTGPETLVEAGSDAWYWAAPLPDGSFNAAVFVDRAQCAGLTQADRETLYRDYLRRSELLSPCLAGARLSPIRICDAGSHADEIPVDDTSLKVGEASCAIDPLSSQGVQSAMASAVQASIVINTILRRPENAVLARRFYKDRQQETRDQHIALAQTHYARHAQTKHATPFWHKRAASARRHDARADIPPVTDLLKADVTLQRAPDASVDTAPVVAGNQIKPGAALSHPALSRPVVYLGDCELAPLLDHLSSHPTARKLHGDWAEMIGHDRAAEVLSWLWENRIVQPLGTPRL